MIKGNLLPKFNFDPHFFLLSLNYAVHDRANTPVRPYEQMQTAMLLFFGASPQQHVRQSASTRNLSKLQRDISHAVDMTSSMKTYGRDLPLRRCCFYSSVTALRLCHLLRGELKFLYLTLKLKIQGRMHCDRGVRIVRPGVRYIRRDGTKKHMRHPLRGVA